MTKNRSIWIALALLCCATLSAQAPAPTPRPKFAGATVSGAPGAAAVAPAAAPAAAKPDAARAANVKTDLGIDAAITPDVQIKRLQKKVAELTQLAHALQTQVDSMNKSLDALNHSTITYRCEGTRSVNSLGAIMECSPYACDATSGRCFRPLCATTAECASGFACDVSATSLCISTR
jgi:hypothetical protein